ncbi:MAG: hypothetical protein AAF318_04085 [Pseudomonadota bacterium]
MTPTLAGRWQTRILLTLLVGLPVTFLFSLFYFGLGADDFDIPFRVLAAILILGLLLDPLYIALQGFRWDHDWPFAFQVFFSIVEFLIVLGIGEIPGLDDILGFNAFASFDRFLTFATHFGLVLLPSTIAVLGVLQIFLLRWRFKGGQLGRMK